VGQFKTKTESNENRQGVVVQWRCIDALHGQVLSHSEIILPEQVVQIVPFRPSFNGGDQESSSNRGCAQAAALLLEDDTIHVVPDDAASRAGFAAAAEMGNFHIHKIDHVGGTFRSLRVETSMTVIPPKEDGSNPPVARASVMGESNFDPSLERIIKVTYPARDEVVQSPSTSLGDDSLLLKYLNPHLCVVVTVATRAHAAEMLTAVTTPNDTVEGAFYRSLTGTATGGGVGSEARLKRKPAGAGTEKEPTLSTSTTSPPPTVPTLFVNIIDSVSGRIVHRVSHAHALTPTALTTTSNTTDSMIQNIPVAISENWVVYSFVNERTRRTEIGVVTLHEGMIDKGGLTAFHTPYQQPTFSGLTSSDPIALSKTFSISVPISAIGSTITKSGISTKNFLMATGVGGSVFALDRRWLDPRRPASEPREAEKKEGLMQYSPLLPIIPPKIVSHKNKIISVTSIISAPANLESLSLTLAFGGPDVFFARIAPAKRFDSLPDDFNKILLLSLLVGLLALVNFARVKSKKKFVSLGWS